MTTAAEASALNTTIETNVSHAQPRQNYGQYGLSQLTRICLAIHIILRTIYVFSYRDKYVL